MQPTKHVSITSRCFKSIKLTYFEVNFLMVNGSNIHKTLGLVLVFDFLFSPSSSPSSSSIFPVQSTMEDLSIQDWTETRSSVLNSPEPPDPAYSKWDSVSEELKGGMMTIFFFLLNALLI